MWPLTSTPYGLVEALRGWPPPALDPAGPHSEIVTTLTWVLLAMSGSVLSLVLLLLALGLFGSSKWRKRVGGERIIWLGGLALPVVVLTALLVYGLVATQTLTAPPRPGEMRVRVTGEMWWWRVAYLDHQGEVLINDANEVHIPVGQPVTFELEAADVIHSFWVPRLGGKLDMIPGRRNILRLQADEPGVYAGQCAEYCGGPHALMGIVVVAHTPDDFARWRGVRVATRAPLPDPEWLLGAEVFARSGCGACHSIAGTTSNGLAGPDLTHVGSRRSLGAGILPNNRGALAGWVADSQTIKPGNRMPSYKQLSGVELRAVAAFLKAQR